MAEIKRKPISIEDDYFPKTEKPIAHADKPAALFVPTDPIDELRLFLKERGKEFRTDWLGGHDKTLAQQMAGFKGDFWADADYALYHGIVFGEDVWKEPYRRIIAEKFPKTTRLLDYRAGVGSDGLKLAALGYPVEFYELGMSADFVEFRLNLRGLKNKVYRESPEKADLVYAFNVVESKEDLDKLAELGDSVMVNLTNNRGLAGYIRQKYRVLDERDFQYALLLLYTNR